MGKSKPTREEVIRLWKQLNDKSNKPVGLNIVCAKFKVHPYHISQLFPEGIVEMMRKHGFMIDRRNNPYTHDEILERLDKVVSQYGIPTWKQIRLGNITEKVIRRLFQKTDDPKRDLLCAYKEWLKKNKPDSENLHLVENGLKGENKSRVSPMLKIKRNRKTLHVSAKTGGKAFGKPLGFRNMIYEPTEEEGVVLLFGMVSEELGYYIEGAWQSFPDCVAKRRISSTGRQETVRIEFEYKSRQFDHPVEGCDLIVCWEDNWGKDCPIEVLELRKVIKKLPKSKK